MSFFILLEHSDNKIKIADEVNKRLKMPIFILLEHSNNKIKIADEVNKTEDVIFYFIGFI
jgi:hypothetical protein